MTVVWGKTVNHWVKDIEGTGVFDTAAGKPPHRRETLSALKEGPKNDMEGFSHPSIWSRIAGLLPSPGKTPVREHTIVEEAFPTVSRFAGMGRHP